MLNRVDDVARVISEDERFSDWSVHAREDGYLEIVNGEVFQVLVWPELWRDPTRFAPHMTRARTGNYALFLMGSDQEFADGRIDQIDPAVDAVAVTIPVSVERLVVAVRARGTAARLRMGQAALELNLERARHENELLISIGRALSRQRDIGSLLDLILRRAREVSGADAGSVYIVQGDHDDVSKRILQFSVSQNDSQPTAEFKGFTMPVSGESIVGTAVLSAEVVNIPDLYKLDPPGTGNNPWGFVHDRTLDDFHGYQTRSILTAPMISARGDVIGVIQLINKRARGVTSLTSAESFNTSVVPFDEVSENYASTLASQAGIALETALLYDEVKTLFEGFVRASVTAIESRDPTTSGHSERVAKLTVGLAKVVDRSDDGRFASVIFTADDIKQIEWAGLLHDFGKVGVREHVLVKAKKLYPHQRELILQRFQFIRRTLESEGLRKRVDRILSASREKLVAGMDRDPETERKLGELDEYLEFILKANEPTVLERGGFERIAEIAALRFLDIDGSERPYLTEEEALALQVPRGSLTAEERAEIESHVVHTFNFLKQIPWGRVYRDIPGIAGAHHEKLNGRGYPRGLTADAIPLPAKMMTISDIYDALTASDRPYKRAVPVAKALDILGYEVKDGHLDPDLYQLFLDAKIYELGAGKSKR